MKIKLIKKIRKKKKKTKKITENIPKYYNISEILKFYIFNKIFLKN